MTMEHEEEMDADWTAKELSVLRSAELDVPPRGSVEKTLAAIGAGAALGIGVGAGTASSVGGALKVASMARWTAATKWLTAAAVGAGVASAALMVHRQHGSAPAVSAANPVVAAVPMTPPAAPSVIAPETPVAAAAPAVSVEALPLAAPSAPVRGEAAAPARESSETLAAEIRLIDQARGQLRGGDAQGALATLAQYEQLVGHGGSMRAEATVVRIEALQASGDSARASALGQRFLAKNPSSAYADYVKRVLARAN